MVVLLLVQFDINDRDIFKVPVNVFLQLATAANDFSLLTDNIPPVEIKDKDAVMKMKLKNLIKREGLRNRIS